MKVIIPQRHNNFVFSALMSFSMSLPMSAIMLAINGDVTLGWEHFLTNWMRTAVIAFIIALPIALLVSPHIRDFTNRLTRSDKTSIKNAVH